MHTFENNVICVVMSTNFELQNSRNFYEIYIKWNQKTVIIILALQASVIAVY